MTAGNLRDRITIQRSAPVDDGYGNTVAGPWVDVATVWADVMERPGSEKIESGALHSSRLATIRVRQSALAASITAADRIMARGAPWNIRSTAAVGRDRELIEFLVETGVAT